MGVVWDKAAVQRGLETLVRARPALLCHLADLLDGYHGTHHGAGYFEILAGDWLDAFAHLSYAAFQEAAGGDVRPGLADTVVPVDIEEFGRMRWESDTLHQQLRSAAALLRGGGSPAGWGGVARAGAPPGRSVSWSARALRAVSPRRPEVLAVQPYVRCSRREWAGALWSWRDWLAWDDLHYPIAIEARVDEAWRRARAEEACPATDLVGVVKALMPLFLPIALLEGFSACRASVLALPVARPRAVYSAIGLHNHLVFKLLAAEWRAEGTKLLYHQHGGGYGLDRIHALEDYETGVADRFFSWGWTRSGRPVSPLSPPVDTGGSRRGDTISVAVVDFPQQVYRLHFHPMPGTVETMMRETRTFLTRSDGGRGMTIRPYPHDYGWGMPDLLREAAPAARFDRRRQGAAALFRRSRLAVHTYLGTSWLETLAMDIPTLAFYDPDTYAFRDEARPLVEGLERAGILHASGAAAAGALKDVRRDVEGWWRDPALQSARVAFCERYAGFSPRWKDELARALEAEIAAP